MLNSNIITEHMHLRDYPFVQCILECMDETNWLLIVYIVILWTTHANHKYIFTFEWNKNIS